MRCPVVVPFEVNIKKIVGVVTWHTGVWFISVWDILWIKPDFEIGWDVKFP
jgi:hypothetical protein